MVVIGITGPSGSGKGLVSDIMKEYGVRVIDSDAIYHDIISPPSDCLDELERYFGKDIILDNGALNRKALASRVFESENKDDLNALNSITHKYVVARIREIVTQYSTTDLLACAIDAPLLIEAGLLDDCDFTLSVIAEKQTRAERISKRDGLDHKEALSRIDAQKNDDFYMMHTDYIIHNDGDVCSLRARILAILDERGLVDI